ncbi:hypothetical protein OG884_05750 [Streptosporangium sp. NBC_01755]|uniref:hypothetical protein n=1 Tax=Streptosporangium sp. NBC_01755 TaxID=2975949 RepID=UPI002DD979C1|nr:hypothetical protein [Streptosporangium sp. NBC_01755]WSD01429.1 hypothetical protein OG884_05750 [Streptosporangium sp. NBC_01755]
MASIDDILGQMKLPERIYNLCVRADLRAEWEQAEKALAVAEAESRDSLAGLSAAGKSLAKQLRDLEAEMEKYVAPLRLRALTHRGLSDLQAAHPPREDKDESTFNVDTFGVGLLSACAVDPVMSEEKAGQLIDGLTHGQWDDLFNTLWSLNRSSVDVPKSRRASATLLSTKKK